MSVHSLIKHEANLKTAIQNSDSLTLSTTLMVIVVAASDKLKVVHDILQFCAQEVGLINDTQQRAVAEAISLTAIFSAMTQSADTQLLLAQLQNANEDTRHNLRLVGVLECAASFKIPETTVASSNVLPSSSVAPPPPAPPPPAPPPPPPRKKATKLPIDEGTEGTMTPISRSQSQSSTPNDALPATTDGLMQAIKNKSGTLRPVSRRSSLPANQATPSPDGLMQAIKNRSGTLRPAARRNLSPVNQDTPSPASPMDELNKAMGLGGVTLRSTARGKSPLSTPTITEPKGELEQAFSARGRARARGRGRGMGLGRGAGSMRGRGIFVTQGHGQVPGVPVAAVQTTPVPNEVTTIDSLRVSIMEGLAETFDGVIKKQTAAFEATCQKNSKDMLCLIDFLKRLRSEMCDATTTIMDAIESDPKLSVAKKNEKMQAIKDDKQFGELLYYCQSTLISCELKSQQYKEIEPTLRVIIDASLKEAVEAQVLQEDDALDITGYFDSTDHIMTSLSVGARIHLEYFLQKKVLGEYQRLVQNEYGFNDMVSVVLDHYVKLIQSENKTVNRCLGAAYIADWQQRREALTKQIDHQESLLCAYTGLMPDKIEKLALVQQEYVPN